jgi:RNA polymerase sigma-70 factor (ECF subfamily)
MQGTSTTGLGRQRVNLYMNGGDAAAGTPGEPGYEDDELFIRQTFGTDPTEACSLLFRRYYVALSNHAVRLVYSKEVAADIVAEVFFQFWKNQTHEHITTSYRAYLFKAIRNRAYNYLKLELGKRSILHDVFAEPVSRQPDQHLFFCEFSRRVEELVEAMPPQCKSSFIMHRFEGKKYQEIADVLQISARTVEVHIRRAVAILKRGLKEGGFLGIMWLLNLLR